MKSNIQHIVGTLIISISLICAISGKTFGENLSVKDEDGYILYKYSMLDAKKRSSSKIATSNNGNTTTYNFNGHKLSCGTIMTGVIFVSKEEEKTTVVGDFNVEKNTFKISKLSVNFFENKSRKRSGTITIDEKVLDIGNFSRM